MRNLKKDQTGSNFADSKQMNTTKWLLHSKLTAQFIVERSTFNVLPTLDAYSLPVKDNQIDSLGDGTNLSQLEAKVD